MAIFNACASEPGFKPVFFFSHCSILGFPESRSPHSEHGPAWSPSADVHAIVPSTSGEGDSVVDSRLSSP